MLGGQRLLAALKECGVEVMFGIPGGAILPLVDALHSSDIRLVVTRNEAAAAHAADGYARASGRVGVCLATSGPGGTNLLTGLSTAASDSIPVLALVGQVSTHLIGTDAFQETDVFGLSLGLTKESYRITDPRDIGPIVRRAMAVALHGRPGPVLIELPKDVQVAQVTEDGPEHPLPEPLPPPPALRWARVRHYMKAARRPLLYIGGGMQNAPQELLVELSERYGAPVVSTLLGIGVMPSDHPHYLGMLGMHGTWTANHAAHETDLLIAMGARFDDRVTSDIKSFAPYARIIHMEIDPAEVGKIVPADLVLLGDVRDLLPKLVEIAPRRVHRAWWETIRRWQREHPLPIREDIGDGIPSPIVMRTLGKMLAPTDVVTTEVGQHQMWAALHLPRYRPRTFLTSGGTGTMGYGFPAAIGAAFARPHARVVAILGDGSFQMQLAELATVSQYGVPILLLLLNNHGHGMVRQWQDLFYGGRRVGSDLVNPDFVKIAEAFGIPGRRVEAQPELEAALQEWQAESGPFLIEVRVPVTEPVFPMVPSGEPITAVREG